RRLEPAARLDAEAHAAADHRPELRAPRRGGALHPIHLQPDLAAGRARVRPARPRRGARLAQLSAGLGVELPAGAGMSGTGEAAEALRAALERRFGDAPAIDPALPG